MLKKKLLSNLYNVNFAKCIYSLVAQIFSKNIHKPKKEIREEGNK
jgi:hypothetical protein